jgi:hypothetical protein
MPTFTTTLATPATTGFSLSEARAWVRQFSRNASGSSRTYVAAEVDRAIQSVGQEFLRRVRCIFQKDTITLTADDAEADFSGILNFRAGRIRSVWVDDRPLSLVPYGEILESRLCHAVGGCITKIGFVTATLAEVYATPTEETTLNLLWRAPFTTWTPGVVLTATATASVSGGAVTAITVTGGGGEFATAPAVTFSGGGGTGAAATAVLNSESKQVESITVDDGGTGYTSAPTVTIAGGIADPTLNIPVDLMPKILTHGAPAELQHNDPEMGYAGESWKKFQEFIKSCAGGHLGVQVMNAVPSFNRLINGDFVEGGIDTRCGE